MGTNTPRETFELGDDRTIHRLGFGAMRLTGENIIGRPDDEEKAREVLRRAVDLGVDFIDTADSYGPNVSERLIREALHPYPDDLFIATKGGLLRNRSGDWIPMGDPNYLRDALLSSLDRLALDRIDLYQYHRPDPDTPLENSITALAELKDDGKIDHIGVSNVTVEQLEQARDIVDIATVQNRYNIGDRSSQDVLDTCEENDIGFIPWAPIRANDIGAKATVLDEVATAHDATREQIALAWLLQYSPVTLPIPGTSRVDHLEDNVAAADIELTDEEMQRLDE